MSNKPHKLGYHDKSGVESGQDSSVESFWLVYRGKLKITWRLLERAVLAANYLMRVREGAQLCTLLSFDWGELRGSFIAQKIPKNQNLPGKILRSSNLMLKKSYTKVHFLYLPSIQTAVQQTRGLRRRWTSMFDAWKFHHLKRNHLPELRPALDCFSSQGSLIDNGQKQPGSAIKRDSSASERDSSDEDSQNEKYGDSNECCSVVAVMLGITKRYTRISVKVGCTCCYIAVEPGGNLN